MPLRRERARCLAEVGPSETVRVERILFHLLKDLCYDLGLEEGDVLRCRRASRAFLVLETAAGRTIIMEMDWARFIEVSLANFAPVQEFANASAGSLATAS
jgi:hypothetical protein